MLSPEYFQAWFDGGVRFLIFVGITSIGAILLYYALKGRK